MNTRKKKGPEVAVKKTDVKKFVRYDEGAKLYSVGKHTFERIAKEAHAVYRVGRITLVNTEIVDEYMEMFREEE